MKKNLPILTGLRFFAAFYVFIFHVNLRIPLDFLNTAFIPIISIGAIGVNVFFILSGFILFYNYHDKSINYIAFILKRLAKIYPMYFAGFLLSFLVTKLTATVVPDFFEILMMNLILVQSYLPKFSMIWYGGGSWSIATEFFFYLCFPILLSFILKLSKYQIISLTAICYLLSVIPGFLHNIGRMNLYLSYSFPPARIWEFVVGMLIACLIVKFKIKIKNFTIILSILSSICYFHFYGRDLDGYVIQNIMIIPLMIVILVCACTFKMSALIFLGWKPFEYLGKISYSFYIIQIPIMLYLDSRNDLISFGCLEMFLVIFGVNLLGAIIGYHLIELPAHKYFNKKIQFTFAK